MSAMLPFNKIAVLMGGTSAEREVSLLSGQGVLAALQQAGVAAYGFDTRYRPVSDLKAEGFDACFIALHGRFGEDGTVQGALELLGIPYTGPGVMTSAIALNKAMTKRIWQAVGLPTPAFCVLQQVPAHMAQAQSIIATLGPQVIVKPVREGSSLGVFKVDNAAALMQAVASALALDCDVLCEQCIVGDEVTCALTGAGARARAWPVIRIVAPEDGGYNFENKYYKNDTQYHVPCGLPAGEEEAIQALALRAYHALESRGWGRIDVMIDGASRKPYLLELNTSPGMTSHSLVPKAAGSVGVSYAQLCVQILASASLDGDRTRG